MFWLILLFILGALCLPLCVLSGVVWLAAATVQGLLTCIERLLSSVAAG
jgi:hypothetical protein